jgi:hypothetical protein
MTKTLDPAKEMKGGQLKTKKYAQTQKMPSPPSRRPDGKQKKKDWRDGHDHL